MTTQKDSFEGDYGSPRYHNLAERSCINNYAMSPSSLTANSQGGSEELTMKGNQAIYHLNVGRMGWDGTGREKGPKDEVERGEVDRFF